MALATLGASGMSMNIDVMKYFNLRLASEVPRSNLVAVSMR